MELCSMLCGSLRERGLGEEWIHVYVWLSPLAVHLKLSQHYQSAIPQNKIKSSKEKKKSFTHYSALVRPFFLLRGTFKWLESC